MSVLRHTALGFFALFVLLPALLEHDWAPLSGLTYVVYGGVTAAMLLPFAVERFRTARGRVSFFALYAACILLVWALPLSACEPLVRALGRVRPGMTREQARAAMAGFHESSSWRSSTQESLCYKHDFDDSNHNADCARVELFQGRVVETTWSPD